VTAALASLANSPSQHSLEPAAHLPVLLEEAIQGLNIIPEGIYVDATFGRGGHSTRILQSLGPTGRLIAFDRDPDAVSAAHAIVDKRFEIIHAPFSELQQALTDRGVAQIDGVLADLGVSSPQLDAAVRGFSFRADGPLDMRMDPTRGIPVSAWIADASAKDIKEVIASYGEERFAFQIADAIKARCDACARGEAEPLASTKALADLVAETLRRCRARKEPGQHPATRTFQALRIHINSELEELKTFLQAALDVLRESGRIAVISFHSLEDRVVKQFFREHAGKNASVTNKRLSRGQQAFIDSMNDQAARHASGLPGGTPSPSLRLIGRVRPSASELTRNPRARSATLRIAERQTTPMAEAA
jgi:16S rRNA (cytosine1402-N4)-methyltransferase